MIVTTSPNEPISPTTVCLGNDQEKTLRQCKSIKRVLANPFRKQKKQKVVTLD